jgi:hypothetical protein|nr:MAG TPA: hypothetical protein [Caudoviricetes sp.]
MNKKKYYAITTEMVFKKTVLVPIEEAKDIEQAERIVDAAVEDCTVMVLDEDAECNTYTSEYADENGMYELTEKESECYQIICEN